MTEQKLEVGDRVRCVNPGPFTEAHGIYHGALGMVERVYRVRRGEGAIIGFSPDEQSGSLCMFASRFEKIEESEPPRKGDRVRVVLEGEFVTDDGLGSMTIKQDDYGSVHFDADGASVEIIERAKPKVTEFRPGDLIESTARGYRYLITTDKQAGGAYGYISLQTLASFARGQFPAWDYHLISRDWEGIKAIGKGNA